MNFVALIGLIVNIEKINNKNYLDLKINSSNLKSYIAKVYIKENDIENKIKIGDIIGINGKIDFNNNNQIISKSFTVI